EHVVCGIKDRRLVLLKIAVVCERERFKDRQEGYEVSDGASRLSAGELRDVRVPLLRHEAAPGSERRGRADESEFRRGPLHDLFSDRREMDREEGEVEQELREVVAVAHRVDRVLERRGEADGPGRDGGVDRKGASREGARSERRDVRAVVRVSQPAVVPRETPEV